MVNDITGVGAKIKQCWRAWIGCGQPSMLHGCTEQMKNECRLSPRGPVSIATIYSGTQTCMLTKDPYI